MIGLDASHRLRRLVAGLSLVLLIAGCNSAAPPPSGDQPAAARLGLTEVTPIDAPGVFLVTPRWSPDGEELLLSGRGGIGLYQASARQPRAWLLDPQYRGLARLDRDHQLVIPERSPGDNEELVFEGGGVKVFYNQRYGEVLASAGGQTRLLAEDAWRPKVSSDGRLVAICEGPRLRQSLRVVTCLGDERYRGLGSDPDWIPGQHRLVFALPSVRLDQDGQDMIAGSELYLLDVEKGTAHQLTATRYRYEMQPSVSPDGVRLAFSDWRTGTAYLAVLDRRGGGR